MANREPKAKPKPGRCPNCGRMVQGQCGWCQAPKKGGDGQ